MEKPTYKLCGAPCGTRGQYTFHKALRVRRGARERVLGVGEFCFVKIWPDSELVAIGELQLLWTDRVLDKTLVGLRLYFLPENTPQGRRGHGEHEVLVINEKVVLKAEDFLTWLCDPRDWELGLRVPGGCAAAGARGAPGAPDDHTQALILSRLDFGDVERERESIEHHWECQPIAVLSYPAYCRARARAARSGPAAASALLPRGGRLLYCRDTFEYPELEGHELVCNQLLPRVRSRPRRRRRRTSADNERSDEDYVQRTPTKGGAERSEGEAEDAAEAEAGRSEAEREEEDRSFMKQLKAFYRSRNESFRLAASVKDVSLARLYAEVRARGGYASAAWRATHAALALRPAHHAATKLCYERFLLSYENHERRRGAYPAPSPAAAAAPVDTIDLAASPPPGGHGGHGGGHRRGHSPSSSPPPGGHAPHARGRRGHGRGHSPSSTPPPGGHGTHARGHGGQRGHGRGYSPSSSPSPAAEAPAERLNREFLDSLPARDRDGASAKTESESERERERDGGAFLNDLAIKYLGTSEPSKSPPDSALSSLSALGDKYVNGHAADEQKQRPAGRSSLRSVRVKPARVLHTATSTTASHSASSSSSPPAAPSTPAAPSAPAATNFGINYPAGHVTSTEDDVVEVPYRASPEVIDLDSYPESPLAAKQVKLDILKERGLEVTPVPFPPAAAGPFLTPMQHQLLHQTHLLHMYAVAPNFPNGAPPPPKVIQGKSIYGSYGPEKTVYNHPKDPFMPPPHILQGTPIKPTRSIPTVPQQTPQEILDLTCKSADETSPAKTTAAATVEIVRVPTPSPHKSQAQNLTKNYTLVDGKAVVGSNLEITLVKQQTPKKTQKRSSNGKFTKTTTPPREANSEGDRPSIIIPSYQVDAQKDPKQMQNFLDPLYMNALYSSLANSLDSRQLAMYRELLANQMRSYNGLMNLGVMTPTTKN